MESSRGSARKLGSGRSSSLNSRGGALLVAVACAALAGAADLPLRFALQQEDEPTGSGGGHRLRGVTLHPARHAAGDRRRPEPAQAGSGARGTGRLGCDLRSVRHRRRGVERGDRAGQQVTAADFSHANITISAYLTGDQRAIAFSLDATTVSPRTSLRGHRRHHGAEWW